MCEVCLPFGLDCGNECAEEDDQPRLTRFKNHAILYLSDTVRFH